MYGVEQIRKAWNLHTCIIYFQRFLYMYIHNYTSEYHLFVWVFQEPISNEETTTMCCFCCVTEPVTSRLKLDRRGYAPGDDIFVDCEVVNMSEEYLHTVSLILERVRHYIIIFIPPPKCLHSASAMH